MFAPRLNSTRRSFARDRRGNVALSFSLATLPALYLIGLGVDYGRALSLGQRLQQAVDQAALAGAYLTDSERTTRVANAIRASLDGTGLSVEYPPTIAYSSSTQTLAVSVSATMQTNLSGLLVSSLRMTKAATVQTGASTTSPTYGRACVLALQTSNDAIYTNSSTIVANCGLYSNSGSPNGMDINGSSAVTSTFSCVAGNYDKDFAATMTPTPTINCATMADPFTSLTAPYGASSSSCDWNGLKIDGNATINPGIYCNGLEIKGGVTVTLNEGAYIIKNGQFKIGSSAVVSGTNVLIYMSGSNSTFDWGSSSEVKLKGRTDGDQKGIVFWSASSNSSNHKFGCNNASYLEGVVYSPSTGVEIGSSGTVNGTADWTAWVVRRLQMGSSAGLSIQTKFSSGATPMPDALASGGLNYLLAAGATVNNQPYLIR